MTAYARNTRFPSRPAHAFIELAETRTQRPSQEVAVPHTIHGFPAKTVRSEVTDMSRTGAESSAVQCIKATQNIVGNKQKTCRLALREDRSSVVPSWYRSRKLGMTGAEETEPAVVD